MPTPARWRASPRNLADDVLAEVGRRGGVVGVNCIPAFLGPGDPIDRAVAHHDHIASVAGDGAPAFGADFCDWLGGGDDDVPLLPDDPTEEELAHARTPEPPRETFYADVLGRLGERGAARRWPRATRCGFCEGCCGDARPSCGEPTRRASSRRSRSPASFWSGSSGWSPS